MTFLVADGVVPSNEDRGYVLRRVMRRAIQHGRALGFAPGFLTRYARAGARADGRRPTPSCTSSARRSTCGWPPRRRASAARSSRASRVLRELIERAREGAGAVSGADAFRLHDTFGFPIELTRELAAEEGLAVDDSALRRADGRPAAAQPRGGGRAAPARSTGASARARSSPPPGFPTRFTGYETTEQATTVGGGRARERPRARQARRLAVLRRGRRPGLRRRHDRVRRRRLRRARRGRRAHRRGPGAVGGARGGRAARRRARDRARRPPDPPRDRVQPHGDAPAARGAAPAPGHPRPPGGLLRRARTSCASTSATARR